MTTTLTTPNGYPRISLTDNEGNLLEATFVDATSTVHFSITDPAGGGADVSIPFGDVDSLVLALSEASQRHRQNQAWQGFWQRQEGQS